MSAERCDIIDDAIRRYFDIIFYPGGSNRNYNEAASLSQENSKQYRGYLDSVEIRLNKPCEYLPLADMLESCKFMNSKFSLGLKIQLMFIFDLTHSTFNFFRLC